MGSQIVISKLIEEEIGTKELQEKYLNLLISRIDENRKSIRNLISIMLVTVLAFPLIIETKISEISFGPFKLQDNSFAISIIPTIFAFSYYKYITVWYDLIDQKNVYKILTAGILSIEKESLLNEILRPYSFFDSVAKNHLKEKSKTLGCIITLLWLPIIIGIGVFPFIFEYYSIKILYTKFRLRTIFDWVFLISPILTSLFTLIVMIQVGKKDIARINEVEKKQTSS